MSDAAHGLRIEDDGEDGFVAVCACAWRGTRKQYVDAARDEYNQHVKGPVAATRYGPEKAWLAVYLPSPGRGGLHVYVGRLVLRFFWPPWRRIPGPHFQVEWEARDA